MSQKRTRVLLVRALHRTFPAPAARHGGLLVRARMKSATCSAQRTMRKFARINAPGRDIARNICEKYDGEEDATRIPKARFAPARPRAIDSRHVFAIYAIRYIARVQRIDEMRQSKCEKYGTCLGWLDRFSRSFLPSVSVVFRFSLRERNSGVFFAVISSRILMSRGFPTAQEHTLMSLQRRACRQRNAAICI